MSVPTVAVPRSPKATGMSFNAYRRWAETGPFRRQWAVVITLAPVAAASWTV